MGIKKLSLMCLGGWQGRKVDDLQLGLSIVDINKICASRLFFGHIVAPENVHFETKHVKM
jgi:hypothetical protein